MNPDITSNQNKTLSNKKNLRLFMVFLLLPLMLFSINCSTSDNEEVIPEEFSEEEAVDILIGVLIEADLDFPYKNPSEANSGKAHSRYVKSAETSLGAAAYIDQGTNNEGNITINLWLDQDGYLIPKPAWQTANPDYCSNQGRYMKGAVNLLQFTVFSSTAQLQLNYTSVETGVTSESVFQESALSETNWLEKAMKEALGKMREKVNIKGTSGPCGSYKGITIYFDSTMKAIGQGSPQLVQEDRVLAEFTLTPNEDGLYDGNGVLRWIKSTNGVQNCTVPDGSLTIKDLRISPQKDISLYMNFEAHLGSCNEYSPHPAVWKPTWVIMHVNEVEGNYFHLQDWTPVPENDNIIARKVYDRTRTISEEASAAEHTLIEIRLE